MHLRILSLCMPLALVACGEAPPSEAIVFETLGSGSTYEAGCTERPDDRLIRNDADWANYWSQVHPGTAPARPEVDFATDSVLASCGWQPSPGYGYEITSVRQLEGAAIVQVTVADHEPGPGCAEPAVIAYTHHAVRIAAVVDAADFTHGPLAGPPC